MKKDELKEAGVNDALIHEDFMVGSEDLSIKGETWDGELFTVFEKGNCSGRERTIGLQNAWISLCSGCVVWICCCVDVYIMQMSLW